MTTAKIDLPPIVTRSEWHESRKRLLAKEKALTRARDQLNAERRRLPMVEVTELEQRETDGSDGARPAKSGSDGGCCH